MILRPYVRGWLLRATGSNGQRRGPGLENSGGRYFMETMSSSRYGLFGKERFGVVWLHF